MQRVAVQVKRHPLPKIEFHIYLLVSDEAAFPSPGVAGGPQPLQTGEKRVSATALRKRHPYTRKQSSRKVGCCHIEL